MTENLNMKRIRAANKPFVMNASSRSIESGNENGIHIFFDSSDVL